MALNADYGKAYAPVLLASPKIIDHTSKVLYTLLVFRGNSIGLVFSRDYGDLAIELDVSIDTIRRSVNRLAKVGVIEVHPVVGSNNEIKLVDFDDELLARLGTKATWSENNEVFKVRRKARRKSARGSKSATSPRQICKGTPGKSATPIGKETERKPKGTPRTPFDDIFGDENVVVSSRKAVARKKSGHTQNGHRPKTAPPEDLVGEALYARRTVRDWAKAFRDAMRKKGYTLAYSNRSQVLSPQISSVVSALLERDFSHVQVNEFLVNWFPGAYEGMAEQVFLKKADDELRTFSVAWLEPRLDEVVRRFKNQMPVPTVGRSSKIRTVKSRRDKDAGVDS